MSVRQDQDRAASPERGRRTDQLHRLASAALLLNSTLSVDELLQVITEQARETVGAHEAVTSMAVDGDRSQALTAVSLSDRDAEPSSWAASADGNGVSADVFRENRAVRLTQDELGARLDQAGGAAPPPRGWLAAPLVDRDGRIFGLIQLSDKADGGDFTNDDEAILVQLAQMASAAVANARLYERAQQERDRLAAVYRMAEAVGRAASLDEIFDAALAALASAVGAERASILLVDGDGVMRFRAWRGLSDAYRSAVDGHSPWSPENGDAEPILVPDVELDAGLAERLPVLAAEGIRSLAFVPLVHGRRLIGKYTLYFDSPHEFTADEVQVAQTIASQLASATQRRRAEDELRASRTELEAIFRGVADGITVQDPSGRVVYANDAAARLIGFEDAEQFLAAPIEDVVARFEILDEERRPLDLDLLPGRRALRGEADSELVVCYRIRETREERWSILRASPVVDPDGRVRLAINTFHDVTDRKHAEDRLRFLSEASALLSSSLDFDETLAQLGRLIVPALADYCLVDLVEPDASLRLAVVHHVDPEREDVLREVRRRYPPRANPSHPASRVLATNEPLLIPRVADEHLAEATVDREHRELYDRLNPSSYLVLPLIAAGRTLGTLSLGAGDSGRRYTEADLVFATEVARRVAAAVENARLYTEIGSSLALLDSLLVSAPVGIGFWDAELRFVRVNDALATLNGLPPEEHVGKTLHDVIPGLAHVLEARYRRVLETGVPSVHQESTDAAAGGEGNERHWLTSCYPVRASDGRAIGVGAVLMEITDRKRADDRLRLLAESGELFSSSLDPDEIFRRVSRVVVPRIADACNIFLTKGNGLVRVAYSHADPELEGLMVSMPDAYDFDRALPPLAEQVFVRGEPLLVPTLTEEFVSQLEAIGLDREAFARVGSQSMIFVPFVVRGDTLGLMSLGSRVAGRYGESDLELAAALAGRASVAIENARLFARTEFQRALLERQGEASIDGLLVVGTDGGILSVNQRFREIWGISAEALAGGDEAALASAGKRLEEPEAFLERVREIYERDETSRDELRFTDGRTIERYGSPVTGEDGHALGYLWSFRDVTEQRRGEDRLRFLAEASTLLGSSLDYEETLASVARIAVPHLADWCSITMADEDGGLRNLAVAHADPKQARWAQELVRRFPPDPEAPVGVAAVVRSGLPELVPELTPELLAPILEHRPELRAAVERLDLRSLLIVPLVARGRVLGAISLATSGDSDRRFVGADLDLALELARRAAVAVDNASLVHELQRRAQAAQALEFVGDGVFLLDEEAVVRLWNPAAAAIFGLAEADVVGSPLREVVPAWDGLAERIPVAGTEARSVRAETVPVDVGGRELWLSISAVRFREGTVYAFRDSTEERALERIKSDFVSTVSHELRTPLAAIYGAAMTLRRQDVPLSADQRDGMLSVVSGEAERLARIVNDILLASRLDSDVVEVAIGSEDARELAQQVVAAAHVHLPDNVQLALRAPAELPPIAADADKLRQVLVNLVENAIKYSPDGGLVEVELTPEESRLRFSVRDRGLGIPPSEQSRIFEKFYRLDPDLTRGVGGTGLGLYICREIVRRMGGRIWVDSTPGAGSTFSFELPLA